MKAFWTHKYFVPVFFAILLVLLFIHNGHISLWDQDEGAYAGFAHRMISTGDWLIPEYPWSFIHRKTPLHFWNIAVSYLLFGENNFAVRFSSALSIWFLFLALYRYGKSLFGELEARLSLLVLATSLFIFSLAKVAVTDATLLLFSTLAAFAVLQHFKQSSWFNTILFWVWVALAMMVKGPPILIFMGFFAVLLFAFHPQRLKLLRLHPWFFLPLALVPLYLWGSAAWQTDNGTFITWLIDWYILKRVGGSVLGQSAPFGTHFLFLIVVFLPYLMFQPKMWANALKETWRKNTDYLVLVLWFVAAWLPYEFSPSKLPAYTVAAHVPLTILIAKSLIGLSVNPMKKSALFYVQIALQMLVCIAIPAAVFYLDLNLMFKLSSVLVALILFGFLIYVITSKFLELQKIIAFNTLFISLVWTVIYGQIDPIKNGPERVGNYLAEQGFQNALIANDKGHPPSLIVYAERAVDSVEINQDTKYIKDRIERKQNIVFVLSEQQWQQLESDERLKLDTTICTNYTDRKGKACYFIASKR